MLICTTRGLIDSRRFACSEYGFYDEVRKRYSIRLWKTIVDVFNCMPCVAIIEDKIFCCHGGISPELLSLEQIHRIARPTDIPDAGTMLRGYEVDCACGEFIK